LLRRWLGKLIADQKRMASSPRRDQVIAETKAAVNRARRLKLQPTRVETFEQAVRRKGYTPEFLASQAKAFKNTHLCLYAVAGTLLVYALHLTLKFNAFYGAGAFVTSACAAVIGYLYGFRAWQIDNRTLIKLQDALRIPGTYLVL
jgi:hypothetical protein